MTRYRRYTVTQYKETGLWYAHKSGFPDVPLFGSFETTRRAAQEHAAKSMALPLPEYLKLRDAPDKQS